MRTAGYEVVEAVNGAEGLEKFRAGAWDVVVTDQVMPGMDGETMTLAIKTIAPGTPVIMTTGTPERITHRELFTELFSKPYSSALIRAAVAGVLSDGGSTMQREKGTCQ